MASINLRKLCTDLEHKFLESAAVRNIARLEESKLRPMLKKAEALASKMKAQARKAIKANAAAAKAKAAAFESAAKRLRARLDKLEKAALRRVSGKRKPVSRRKAAKSAPRKTRGASRPARPRKAAGAGQPVAKAVPSAAPAVRRNPLTHRGSRPRRTQLLLEHQGAPAADAGHSASASRPELDHSSNLGELVRETEVRNRMLKSRADRSAGKRVANMLAVTANARIGGHASRAGRHAQGRRDAAQRGEKRPGPAE